MEYTDIEKKRFENLPSENYRKVYAYLRGLSTSGNRKEAFPKVETMSTKLGISQDHIYHNIIPKLKREGLIIKRRVGRINHYDFPLMYGETLPAPPKEEKINKIDNNMENKPRKKFKDLTDEELVILFTKVKEALNSGSTTLKENLSNALDRYTEELNTPKQEDCQDQIEDFPSANENTENTPQPTIVPTQQRKSVIPEKVDGWLEVAGLVDDKETFKRKCINNGLLMFRNNGQPKDTAQYLYDRLITEAWATMEEVEEKAPDVYSFWKKNQDTFNLDQNN